MIQETALVTRIAAGKVWIKATPSSACGACHQQSSCGTATLSKWLPKREFAVECRRPVQVGDQVTVAIDDRHLLLASVLLYLLPLLVVILGVGMADALLPAASADAWLPEIALSILLATFYAIHRMQNLLLLYFCFRPQIVDEPAM